jgi:hypothetical protein
MLGQTSDASISVRLGFGRWQHRRSPKCTQYGIYADDLGRIERTSDLALARFAELDQA